MRLQGARPCSAAIPSSYAMAKHGGEIQSKDAWKPEPMARERGMHAVSEPQDSHKNQPADTTQQLSQHQPSRNTQPAPFRRQLYALRKGSHCIELCTPTPYLAKACRLLPAGKRAAPTPHHLHDVLSYTTLPCGNNPTVMRPYARCSSELAQNSTGPDHSTPSTCFQGPDRYACRIRHMHGSPGGAAQPGLANLITIGRKGNTAPQNILQIRSHCKAQRWGPKVVSPGHPKTDNTSTCKDEQDAKSSM